jgi:uncharacterized CHY-type Zn-finger protein
VVRIYGETVDDETRCVHYSSPEDIVAIKFPCCLRYYPCYKCHSAGEEHPAARWPEAEWSEPAILCGACRTELSIEQYRSVSRCPDCGSAFNDGCRLHAHLYFEVAASPSTDLSVP